MDNRDQLNKKLLLVVLFLVQVCPIFSPISFPIACICLSVAASMQCLAEGDLPSIPSIEISICHNPALRDGRSSAVALQATVVEVRTKASARSLGAVNDCFILGEFLLVDAATASLTESWHANKLKERQ